MIRVLLYAGQELTRAGLSALLNGEPDISVVSEVGGAKAAATEFERLRPDVLVVSFDSPGEPPHSTSGRPATPLPSVFITSDTDTRTVLDALSRGARGLVSLDDSREYIVDAVREVAGGKAFVTPVLAAAVLDQLVHLAPQLPAAESVLSNLTDRELVVLRLLAIGRTTSEIARDLHVTRATVKSHVSHMLAKLGLEERLQAVVLAYSSGLVNPATIPILGRPPR